MPPSQARAVDARPRLIARSHPAPPASVESEERRSRPEWLVPSAAGRRADRMTAKEEWIIVASKGDTDIVDYLLKRSPVVVGRVIWTDEGPIKFYSSMEEMWRDLAEASELPTPELMSCSGV